MKRGKSIVNFEEFQTVNPDQHKELLVDELFTRSRDYRNSQAFLETINFLSRFRSQKPYNAYLLHVQNPRVSFVRTASQWAKEFGRVIKPDAKPLLVLFPFAPLHVVYELFDTEGQESPEEMLERVHLRQRSYKTAPEWMTKNIVQNARNHGILLCARPMSVLHQGTARTMTTVDYLDLEQGKFLDVIEGNKSVPLFEGQRLLVENPKRLRYIIELNDRLQDTITFETLVHELAHILLGHLGSVEDVSPTDTWKDRRTSNLKSAEFEAECVAYIVCMRLGLEPASWAYLAYYLETDSEIPNMSLDMVLTVSGKIETWLEQIVIVKERKGMKLRKTQQKSIT